jgi:hypothetical protein
LLAVDLDLIDPAIDGFPCSGVYLPRGSNWRVVAEGCAARCIGSGLSPIFFRLPLQLQAMLAFAVSFTFCRDLLGALQGNAADTLIGVQCCDAR